MDNSGLCLKEDTLCFLQQKESARWSRERPNQQKKSAEALRLRLLFVSQLIMNEKEKASWQDNSDLFTFPPKVQLNRLKSDLITCRKNLLDLGPKQNNNLRLVVVSATTVTVMNKMESMAEWNLY